MRSESPLFVPKFISYWCLFKKKILLLFRSVPALVWNCYIVKYCQSYFSTQTALMCLFVGVLFTKISFFSTKKLIQSFVTSISSGKPIFRNCLTVSRRRKYLYFRLFKFKEVWDERVIKKWKIFIFSSSEISYSFSL